MGRQKSERVSIGNSSKCKRFAVKGNKKYNQLKEDVVWGQVKIFLFTGTSKSIFYYIASVPLIHSHWVSSLCLWMQNIYVGGSQSFLLMVVQQLVVIFVCLSEEVSLGAFYSTIKSLEQEYIGKLIEVACGGEKWMITEE